MTIPNMRTVDIRLISWRVGYTQNTCYGGNSGVMQPCETARWQVRRNRRTSSREAGWLRLGVEEPRSVSRHRIHPSGSFRSLSCPGFRGDLGGRCSVSDSSVSG
jgi:hypothetical protein